jgi:predicted anti-sigma-YlaC factor YlaD
MSRSLGLLRILTLRCESASELTSRELDEPLGGLERAALWGHLLVCRSCRRFRGQMRVIRTALRLRDRRPRAAAAEDEALSQEARHRIARALAEAPLDETADPGGDRAPD